MRVLFIYPNLYTQMGFNHGLASLSAVLKEAGHETRLVNLNEKLPPVPTKEQLLEQVRAWGPGLIAFSCLTQQYAAAVELAWFLRESLAPEVLPPLVVGGIHPTMVPSEVMADAVWDHVGVGECEDALLSLVERLDAGESPADVSNFLSWEGGVRPTLRRDEVAQPEQWVHNKVGEFPDLRTLPMPDYELFDTARITAQKNGWFGLLTSRGCPYRCSYCLNHRIVDRYREELGRSVNNLGFFRYRPLELFIEEVRWVRNRYPDIDTFIFDDDLFTQNTDHAIAICEAYREAEIGVPFVVNSHVKRLDPRVAQALGRAGCKILKLGIEAGSPRVRKEILQRFMTQEDILHTVADSEGAGLHTSGFLMVGLPGETHDEREETIELLAQSRIGRFRTSFFFPFPGTESHRLTLEGGFATPESIHSLTTFTDGSCLDFGAEENLFVDKIGRVMPWLVNARLDEFHADGLAAKRYKPLADKVRAMDETAWRAFIPKIRTLDRTLSDEARAAGEWHYSIRYNSSMGVRSDWLAAEEEAVEWATAAAKPSAADLAVKG